MPPRVARFAGHSRLTLPTSPPGPRPGEGIDMATPARHPGRDRRRPSGQRRWVTLATFALVPLVAAMVSGEARAVPDDVTFYSSAAPPHDYPGPEPDSPASHEAVEADPATSKPAPPPSEPAPTRIASKT